MTTGIKQTPATMRTIAAGREAAKSGAQVEGALGLWQGKGKETRAAVVAIAQSAIARGALGKATEPELALLKEMLINGPLTPIKLKGGWKALCVNGVVYAKKDGEWAVAGKFLAGREIPKSEAQVTQQPMGIWQGRPADNKKETISVAMAAIGKGSLSAPTPNQLKQLKALLLTGPAKLIKLENGYEAACVSGTVFVKKADQWFVAGKIIH